MAIRTFQHKGLRRLYDAGEKIDISAALAEKIADVLVAIDEATRPRGCRIVSRLAFASFEWQLERVLER